MSFEVSSGPRGPSPTWGGKHLTSAYDASREARTWAETVVAGPGSLVFVAGDPLGYAADALRSRELRAVSLLPGAAARRWTDPAAEAWAPEDGPLEVYLQQIFEQTGPEAVVWVFWPAFERLAPELALDWGRRFRDYYRTVQGSWLTQRHFGPRLWRNAVRNTLEHERPVGLVPGTRPIVVAASGPSLDDGLAALKRHRDRFDLWALPSSFETLVKRGLSPDAGVATDGGFYAREHLHRLAGTAVPVLAALSSAPDPELSRRGCLFFSQGLAVERALLGAAGTPYPEVPSQGTVAVTALRLALEATSGPVFVAGLDLAFRDLRAHTSPHTVDRRFETVHDRLHPQESLWGQRLLEQATVLHEGVRTSPALLTYAGWFRSRGRFSRQVYRIAPSAVRWDSMTELSWDAAASLWKQHTGRSVAWTNLPPPGRPDRAVVVKRGLATLAARVEAASADDPWLVEAARTAVPEALAEDFRARRRGKASSEARQALSSFLESLTREFL